MLLLLIHCISIFNFYESNANEEMNTFDNVHVHGPKTRSRCPIHTFKCQSIIQTPPLRE